MQIKNEYIKIKQGDNEITLNNYIYNNYLSLFSKTQYDIDESDLYSLAHEQRKKELDCCFIKFDEPLEDITNALQDDFDIKIEASQEGFFGFKNEVNLSYIFHLERGVDTNSYLINAEDYYNRKITALGFSNYHETDIYACIDVSDYEIYVIEGENLSITRKDILKSDAIIYGYDFPVHLSPIGDHRNASYSELSYLYENKYARLYSVGFSKSLGNIDEEYVIGDDIDIKIIDDTSFSFNLLKGENVSIYPNDSLYAGTDVYPLPLYVAHENYPNSNLFPDNNLSPMDSNYKYVFYKFKLYTIHFVGESAQASYPTYNELNESYIMYLENNTKGLFEIITKIERSE